MTRHWDLDALVAASRLTPSEFRTRFRLNVATYDQLMVEGLSDRQADRWSIACGIHPSEAFGDAWFDAALTLGEAA